MKKVYLILPVILILFFESCRNDFNINAPYQDVYVLNCILRNDDSVQYAIISKNVYTGNGASPASASTAQNIKGEKIEIYYNDSVFVMRDTTIQTADSGNITPVNCYYTKDLTIKPGMTISIKAATQDGQVLQSTTRVPVISFSKFSTTFPQVMKPPEVLVPGYQEKPSYSWTWTDGSGDITNILSLPQLEIDYKIDEGSSYVDKKILVPLALYYTFDANGNLIPHNVELSFDNNCLTTLKTINETMQNISGNDPDKKDYIISKVLFNVIGLDQDLSKFYSAYNTYSEDFSIKLRQTDYTNVEGGKGIFGVYYKFSIPLTVDDFYIRSFGYQYKPE
ncbi:MAG: DUF4249 family protein [Ignavibacteriaceae bacterium]